MYCEIEIEKKVKGGTVLKETINIGNINSYRSYVDTSSEGKSDTLQTVVYFKGSIKGTFVNCSYENFKALIKKAQENI